jgi:hypothetical protein
MLIARAFEGPLEELSNDLQCLFLEVNHLKLVEEHVIQNQLNSSPFLLSQSDLFVWL